VEKNKIKYFYYDYKKFRFDINSNDVFSMNLNDMKAYSASF